MSRERKLRASTLGMAAAVAAMGAYVYLVEVRGGAEKAKTADASAHLLPFTPDAASAVEIRRDGEQIRCRKEKGVWRVVAPVQSTADDTTVERLLKDVSEAKIDRTLSPGNPAAYGLDHPTRMTFGSGAQTVSLEVGKENPTSSFVYVRKDGAGPVLLVDRKLRDAADKKLYDLREKEILDFNEQDVVKISFQNRGQQTVLVKGTATGSDNEHSQWHLIAPVKARADRGEVERSLNLCSYIRAEAFISEKPEHLEQYGLDHPWGTVRYDLAGGKSATLQLGKQTVDGALTRYFARRPQGGPVFTINDNLPRDTQRPPNEWRETHLADFPRPDATELRLITPEHTVVCARPDGSQEWGMAEFKGTVAESMDLGSAARMPTARKADSTRVTDLLGHVTAIQAKRSLDGAKANDPQFGLAKPSLKVVILDHAKKQMASVSFGKKGKDAAGEFYYATSPYLPQVVTIPAADVDRFQTSLRDLSPVQ